MATLTPAELAALLGPVQTQTLAKRLELVSSPCEDSSRWRQFAESFSRALTARLRPLVRSAARVTFQGSQSLSAATATNTHNGRSIVGWCQPDQSLEPTALVLAPSLVASFVDRLLGGRTNSDSDESSDQRPLTDVDQRLAARLIDAARLAFQESFPQPFANELPDHSTCDLTLVEAWLPDCELCRLSFDLRFIQGGGTLQILLPHETAAALAEPIELDACSETSDPAMQTTSITPSPTTVVHARMTPTRVLAKDLKNLDVGDVLMTDIDEDHPLDVLVDGRLQFQGQAGTLAGQRAVRLSAPVASR